MGSRMIDEKISAKGFDAYCFKEDEVIILKYGYNYTICSCDIEHTKKYAEENGLTMEEVFRNRVVDMVDNLLESCMKGVVK